MPRGVPKSDGQKIGEKFDLEYRKMKRSRKDERAAKKGCADCGCKGKCTCGK